MQVGEQVFEVGIADGDGLHHAVSVEDGLGDACAGGRRAGGHGFEFGERLKAGPVETVGGCWIVAAGAVGLEDGSAARLLWRELGSGFGWRKWSAAGQQERACESQAEKRLDADLFLSLHSLIVSRGDLWPEPVSLGCGDGEAEFVDGLDGCVFGGVVGQMAVDEDGEDESFSAGGGEVSAEGADFAERAGFGLNATVERGVAEACGECAVLAADGKAPAPLGTPGLASGVGEQSGVGARGDEVAHAHAGAVVEEEILGRDAGLKEELTDDAHTLSVTAVGAEGASEHAQEQLGVEVLADFVGDDDVFGDGRRLVRGEDMTAINGCGEGVELHGMEREGFGLFDGVVGGDGAEAMAGAGCAGDGDAALGEEHAQGRGGEFGGVFDGHGSDVAGGRNGSPQAYETRAGHAVEAWFGIGIAGGDASGIFQRVERSGRHPGVGRAASGVAGDVKVDNIVVKRERGDGRAVTPDEIVPAPADAVGLPGEERVVADDVAVDGANAPRGQLVTERGEVGERVAWRERMVGGFAAIAIGVVARAHRRVTGAEQDEVAVECAVGVDGAGGDEARGPGERVDGQQGRGGGGGEQFGIRCRGEALFVVPGEEDAAVERGDAHADVRLSERGRGEDGQEALGECGIGLRLGLRRGGASGEGAGEQADGEQDAARKKGRHRRSVDDRAWMGEQEFCYFMWILARIQRLPKTKKAMVQTTTAAGNPQ